MRPTPTNPKTPPNILTMIHSVTNGECKLPVLATSIAAEAISALYTANVAGRTLSCGAKTYSMKLSANVVAAIITPISEIVSDLPIGPRVIKYGKKYSAITTKATNIATSQMRRCQKRLIANGCMVPPTLFSVYYDKVSTKMLLFFDIYRRIVRRKN